MDYVEAFQNLKEDERYGCPLQNKMLLLFSIIELMEDGTLTKNEISLDDVLSERFKDVFHKLFPKKVRVPDICVPFWAMQDEEFWHVFAAREKNMMLSRLNSQLFVPTESEIRECIRCVELDESLYFMLTLRSGRESMKRALLETYTTLSHKQVDALSVSRNSYVDKSSSAISTYECIVKGAKSVETDVCRNSEVDFDSLNEEVRILLNIQYFTFLKEHRVERSLFMGICPTVSEFYNRAFLHAFSLDELPSVLLRPYRDLLSDVKMGLYGEMDVDDLLEKLGNSIRVLTPESERSNDYTPFVAPEIQEDPSAELNSDVENELLNQEVDDYTPKGELKGIGDVVTASYDYLWLLAITDFMGERQQTVNLSFDELACMMLANAWEILRDYPELKKVETDITACVDFLIEESKEYMEEELSWDSPKETIFEAIKDYPMAGVFEDTVDLLLESAPYTVLKAWLDTDNIGELVLCSANFQNTCLYALHPRKVDPFIEVHKKWKRTLFYENANLMAYFKKRYIEFVVSHQK